MRVFGKRISRLNVLLIAAAILFIITSVLITNLVQIKKSQLQSSLMQEYARVDSVLTERFNSTATVIKKMGEEIAKDPTNKNHIKTVLEKYRSDISLNQIFSWTIFSWADTQSQITVDGHYGIMKEPYDLSKRDYIPLAISNPDKMFLGKPIYGSTSGKWMIPGGVAITDHGNRFLGIITIGFEISNLAEIIKKELTNDSINIELVYKDSTPVFDVNSTVVNIFSAEKSDSSAINKDLLDEIIVKKQIGNFPYSLNVAYKKEAFSQIMWEIVYSRFLEIMAIISLSAILISLIYKNEKDKRQEINLLIQREVIINKSKSEFMIRVGHELKNFVAAIIGLSDLVKDAVQDKNMQDEVDHLDHIDDISHELMSFVTDLIDLNQVEDGNFEISRSSSGTDFEDLVFRSVRILKSKIKSKEILLNTEFENDLPLVSGLDQRRVKQIIVSIIGNAVKFSSNGSKIDVLVKKSNHSEIEIVVKDCGIGMTESEITTALSNYNPDDYDATNATDSIELKMPIVRFLIEKQNGSISIKSTKNYGTEVKISFR
jgi:signal transduction histidine kinase